MRQVTLVIMDGVGISNTDFGNAVTAANTPNLDRLLAEYPNTTLKAHGTAVGLPSDDDMGNSEVGHNALGCGQIYSQGAKLVDESIKSDRVFESETWKWLSDCDTVHFIGLLSDGYVHSHINHLFALLDQVKKARVHILLDGRDVPATSALKYIDALEEKCASHPDCKIVSGGGRMKITMDRYEADWSMVELGWKTHVFGQGRKFPSAREAVETLRNENPGVIDQDLPPFVIEDFDGMADGDSVLLFNFRGDRALEISKAFDGEEDFDKFDRGSYPKVKYAGLLEYDSDLKIPKRYLVSPPHIENTMTQLLVEAGIREYAVSETQKYGHVTYFWNGNHSEKLNEALEDYLEIPSDNISFDKAPKMKSAEIADAVRDAVNSGKYGFIRCNFPNGDMVGHTGNFEATVIGVEAVDMAIGRIEEAVNKTDGLLIVTADHGNAEEMLLKDKKCNINPKTSHSLNLVPFIICDKNIKIKDGAFGLANVAPTIVTLLGLFPPACWEDSIV